MEVKLTEVRKTETRMIELEREAWRNIEVVYKQGSRKWGNVRNVDCNHRLLG